MAFLDEDDSLPPVASEPDDRRPPPERQRVFMARRLGAVGAGIVVLILLVLGVRGCLDARKERAFENYVRDLTTLTQESNQLGESFFARFEEPGNRELEFETNVRADRSNAEQLLDRAESLDPPGELDAAQERVELSFALRRDGLAAAADNIGTALSNDSDARDEALEQITVHMQDFLASDFLYTQARQEANAVLGEEGISEKVPRSNFLPEASGGEPDLALLDDAGVSQALAGVAGGRGQSGGVHGLGISSVVIGGTVLAADSPNTVVAQGAPEVEVSIANQGDSEETDIPVSVSLTGGDEPIEAEETLRRIAPGETQTVTVPLDPEPRGNRQLELEVFVEPVFGEQVADNNEFAAEVSLE